MNLIICCTPLQVLIAEKIIDLYPNEKFIGMVLINKKNINDKYRFYYDRLNKKCHKCLWVEEWTNFSYKSYIRYWLKWKLKLSLWGIDKIFFANAEKYFIRMVCHSFSKALIYTFDDGTRNLIENNKKIFTTYSNFHGVKAISNFIGLRYSGESIQKRVQLHYTIYPPPINNTPECTKLRFIPLIDIKNNKQERREKISIFLGQSITHYRDIALDISLTEKIIKENNIQYYFPHPRENYIIKNVEYIDTPLIFEDYFIQNLLDKDITIYTLFSSSVVSIHLFDNVKIISFKPNNLIEDFLQCYDIFSKIGIEIRNLEN